MLKRLRLRFILSAMAAFGFVMLILVIGINLLNYSVMMARQDETIAGIMEYEQMKEALTSSLAIAEGKSMQ